MVTDPLCVPLELTTCLSLLDHVVQGFDFPVDDVNTLQSRSLEVDWKTNIVRVKFGSLIL